MAVDDRYNKCPWCGAPQYGEFSEDDLFPCHDCNLHVRRSILVDYPEAYLHDDQFDGYCAHCAYPVRERQRFAEDEYFCCKGCGATIQSEELLTMAALVASRHRRRTPFWMYLALAIFGFVIVFLVSSLFWYHG